MKTKKSSLRILFNASVIFSGYCSSTGASRKLMGLLKQRHIHGCISEIILDELLRHADKIPIEKKKLHRSIGQYFRNILPAPEEKHVSRYKQFMLDKGDAHLFATYKEARCDCLVSLDKHHVLILKGKIPDITILSPGELLEKLSQ